MRDKCCLYRFKCCLYRISLLIMLVSLMPTMAFSQYFKHYEGIANKTGDYEMIDASKGLMRQKTHECHYTVPIQKGGSVELALPISNYSSATGVELEPRGYYRWYNYDTDMASSRLSLAWAQNTLMKSMNDENGVNRGLITYNLNTGACYRNMGVKYTRPADASWQGEVVACDVSRYIDGCKGTFEHEPTLSIRYVFHMIPAEKRADDITKVLRLASESSANDMTFEDYKDISVGFKATSSKMNIRLSANPSWYYFHPMANAFTHHVFSNDEQHKIQASDLTSTELLQPTKIQWRIYDSSKSKFCVYTYKIAQKPDECRFFQVSLDLLNAGTYQGWKTLDNKPLTSAADKPSFKYGDRAYIVAMAMDDKDRACPIANFTVSLYNHYPMTFEQLQSTSANTRLVDYLDEHYRNVALVSFDDDNENQTLSKPTNADDNQSAYPSKWAKRSYGFVYEKLKDYLPEGTSWPKPHSPIHGEYGIYKSANVSGLSTSSNNYLWWSSNPLYDRTYEITHGAQYGSFLYVDAADESRQIAEADFKANLCAGSQVIFSSAIAEMTSGNEKAQLLFKLYGVHYDENNQETDRKLLHSFSTGDFSNNLYSLVTGKWYQAYGKMVLQKESGVNNYEDFKIVIDNLCKSTQGADYAFDDLRIYTQASKVNVLQSTPICPDVDTEKNPLAPTTVRLKIRALQETMTALDSHAAVCKVYFRFVNADGTPTTDVNYGTIQEPNYKWGYATIYNNVDESRKVDNGPMYEKINDEWNVVLANRYFGLQSNKTYYLSLAIDDETVEDKNQLSWGKPSDVCSLYSQEFQMVQQKVVVNDTNGNIATSVTIPCDENATPEYEIKAQLQTVDQNNGGSINLNGVLFDWYVDDATEPVVKSSNGFKNIPLTVGEHTIRVMPCSNSTTIEQGGVSYEICLNEMSFKLHVVKNGPQLNFGYSGVAYPANYERTVRIGLPQVRELAQQGEGRGYFAVPVRDKNFIVEDSKNLHFVKAPNQENPETCTSVYLSGTNDPAYAQRADMTQLKLAELQSADLAREALTLQVKFLPGQQGYVQLHEGYWYEGCLIFNEDGKDDTKVLCSGESYIRFDVVPEYLTWNPTAKNGMSAAWNNDQNWLRSTAVQLYKSSSAYADDATAQGYVPMKFTKVTIPNLSAHYFPDLGYISYRSSNGIATRLSNAKGDEATANVQYAMMAKWDASAPDHGVTSEGYLECEPFYGNTCDEIYFKPGGEMLGQQYLIYNKVYVEKEMQPQEWYVLTSPLLDTYAGDMYVPVVGGRQETEAFQPIHFSAMDNDRIQSPAYQRSWDTASAEEVSLGGSYAAYDYSGADTEFDKQTLYHVSSHWSHVYNQLNKAYTPMEGFALKMGDKYASATQPVLLRLPKADTHYDYYSVSASGGSPAGVDVDKQEAYRLVIATDAQENAIAKMTYPLARLSAGNDYYLVGNPYMATLSMYKFLRANPSLAPIFYTYEDGKIKFYDSVDLSLSTYDSQNDVTIAPMQAFFVRVADGESLDQISFTSQMTIDREVLGTRNQKLEARYMLSPSRSSSTDVALPSELPASGSLMVFTMDGKLLCREQQASLESVMHRLPSGTYIVQIKTDDGECHSVKIGVK